MTGDSELLQQFVSTRSDAAFARLVERHLSLVYYTALRQLGGDAHAAKDVTQSVFVDLARKAPSLTDRATLTGWLHTSTRYAAAKFRRAENSRKRNVEEAMRFDALNPEENSVVAWERLRPVLDEAVEELHDRDREALLLRFFEGASYGAIGAALNVSEDAARMRVERALEKMRAGLARRGVTSTGMALSLLMTEQLSTAAPAGLAAPIVQAALVSSAGTLVTGVGLGVFMAQKSLIVAGIVTLIATGTAVMQWNHAHAADATLASLSVENKELETQLQNERQSAKQSREDIAILQAQIETLKTKPVPVAASAVAPTTPREDSTLGLARWEIQQGALGNLRQIDSARKQFKIERGTPATSVAELVGRGRFIKTLRTVAGEDYSGLSMNPDDPMTVSTPGGITVTFDPSGVNTTHPEFPPEVEKANELTARVTPSVNQAVQAYKTAHNGAFPQNEQALLPYFATPKEGADFLEAVEAKKAAGL